MYSTVYDFILNKDKTEEERILIINTNVGSVNKIESFAIYNNKKYWKVRFKVNEDDYYNTFEPENVIEELSKAMIEYQELGPITFGQPNLILLYDLYKNFISSIARKMSFMFNKIEYDDAFEIGMLGLVAIYNRGMCVTRPLLRKTCINNILYSIRCTKNDPDFVALNSMMPSLSDGSEQILLQDTIIDIKQEYEKQDNEYNEYIKKTFDELKSLFIDLYGQRTWEQFYKEYSSKNTSGWARNTLFKFKKQLNKIGINKESFDKYL